jgi:hypothetical protein
MREYPQAREEEGFFCNPTPEGLGLIGCSVLRLQFGLFVGTREPEMHNFFYLSGSC